MAFPQIDATNPIGTDKVSDLDRFERQTRQWIIDCMECISGYPSVETVAVKAWTTSGPTARPTQVAQNLGRNLLGFNTDTNELEVLKSDGTVSSIVNQVILSMYPVGSYYETSDSTFDPNTAWGGTWVQDTTGRVLVAAGIEKDGSNNNIGLYNYTLTSTTRRSDDAVMWSDQGSGKGGEETHALTRPELPIHYHPHRHPHSHESKNILQKKITGDTEATLGYLAVTDSGSDIPVKIKAELTSGLPNKENYAYSMGEQNNAEIGWFPLSDSSYSLHGMVDADKLTEEEEDEDPPRTISEDLLMHVGTSVGNNGHNNIQPYQVVIRWHRTA